MSGEPEDAYQAMLRQRADDDAVMFAGQASANGSLGFAPVGAELAGGLLAARTGGAMPMGPGEQQRYDTMLQMNGWWAPSGGPRPSLLDTRGPLLQVHSSSEVARLQSGVTLAQPMPAPAPAPPPHPAPHPTRQANTPAPASCLNTPGSWDHMISYTQRNAKAEALAEALYATLRERGRTVWLDIKMEQLNEAAMKEAAQNSKCILAIISGAERASDPDENAYFKRPYCCNELRWAREVGVPIQPVILADDKKRIGEFIGQAPEDLKDLGGVDFIHLDRSRPAYWQVGVDEVIKGADALASQGMRQRSGVQPEPQLQRVSEPEPEAGPQEPEPRSAAVEPRPVDEASLHRLLEMGFEREACGEALALVHGDTQAATVMLLEGGGLGQVPQGDAPRPTGL